MPTVRRLIVTIASISALSIAFQGVDCGKLDDILDKYPHTGFPPTNNMSDDSFTVKISLHVKTFEGIDEVSEHLSLTGYLWLSWVDDYLTAPGFSDNHYSNLITVPRKRIWSPYVALINDPRGPFYMFQGGTSEDLVIAEPERGFITWYPGGNFVANCEGSRRRFPWDSSKCKIVVNSWTDPNWNFLIHEDKIAIDGFKGNETVTTLESSLWKVLNMTSFIEDPQIDYSTAIFAFKLARKPDFYVLSIIYPDAILMFLLLVCLFHPHEMERPAIFVVVLLTFNVVKDTTDKYIPPSSDEVYIISTMLSIHFALGVLFTLESILCLQILSIYGADVRKQRRRKTTPGEPAEEIERDSTLAVFKWLCRCKCKGTSVEDQRDLIVMLLDFLMLLCGIVFGVLVPIGLYRQAEDAEGHEHK